MQTIKDLREYATFAEITQGAFLTLVPNSVNILERAEINGAEFELYNQHGVYLMTVTNYYSKPVTQYYIADINS